MEAWGSPNASKHRSRKANKRLIKGTPSQDPSKGWFWEGSGWIWGVFWEGFGWIGTLGIPNGHENRNVSKEIQVLLPGSSKRGFGEGSEMVWGGLGKVM